MPIVDTMDLSARVCVGPGLEVRFSCAETDELDLDEQIRARLFSPHRRIGRRRWWMHESWTPADYVAVTNERILWLTDRYRRSRQGGGVIARYCSCSRISRIAIDRSHDVPLLVIGFQGLCAWHIPIHTPQFLDDFVEVLYHASGGATGRPK